MAFGSKAPKLEERRIFSPQQSQLQQILLQNLMRQLGGGQPEFDFEKMVAGPARQRFQGETLPMLSERLASLGEGALGSSGFQGMLAGAGRNFESELAGLQEQSGMKQFELQQKLLPSLLGFGMQPNKQYFGMPGQEGWGRDLLRMGGNIASKFLFM